MARHAGEASDAPAVGAYGAGKHNTKARAKGLQDLSKGSARPAVAPVARHPGKFGGDTSPKPGKGGAAIPTPAGMAVGGARAMGRAGGNLGKDAFSKNGAVTGVCAMIFLVVALAKMRGQANIDTKHALFGGFILLLVLTIIAKMNAALGTALAVLVLLQALLEYGPTAFGGLLSGGGGVHTTPSTFVYNGPSGSGGTTKAVTLP